MLNFRSQKHPLHLLGCSAQCYQPHGLGCDDPYLASCTACSLVLSFAVAETSNKRENTCFNGLQVH